MTMLLVLFAFIVMLSFGVIAMASKTRTTSEKKTEALRELDSSLEEKESLTANIESLETPEGRERALRDTYRAAKEGEKLVVIVDESENAGERKEKKGLKAFFYDIFHKDEEAADAVVAPDF